MALTQNDWNKLNIVVSNAIDQKLDEKFDPISKQLDEIHHKLEELYTRIDEVMRRIIAKLDKIRSLIRNIQIP